MRMRTIAVTMTIAVVGSLALAQAGPRPGAEAVGDRFLAMAGQDINEGVAFLVARQKPSGGWGPGPEGHPAFTALAVKALLQHPDYDVDSPPVRRGLEFLVAHQQEDGGIYLPDLGQQNYTTSLAVMALARANHADYQPVLDRAVDYLRGIQITAGSTTPGGESIDEDHVFYGGTSYGRHGRPDLSNLSFTIEALHEAGLDEDDPFFDRALVYLARVQNRSETNDQPWAAVVDDGGFIYATAQSDANRDPESKAGEVVVAGRRGLRSYGSMTYAGFKSLLYANVDRRDPRVQAAFDWIRSYWRLDSNPNMPEAVSLQGLYYYYHTFAKALAAYGQPVITDPQGVEHNWREELIEVLHVRQRPDGSWTNEADRWMESDPELVTSYAVLALQEALYGQPVVRCDSPQGARRVVIELDAERLAHFGLTVEAVTEALCEQCPALCDGAMQSRPGTLVFCAARDAQCVDRLAQTELMRGDEGAVRLSEVAAVEIQPAE